MCSRCVYQYIWAVRDRLCGYGWRAMVAQGLADRGKVGSGVCQRTSLGVRSVGAAHSAAAAVHCCPQQRGAVHRQMAVQRYQFRFVHPTCCGNLPQGGSRLA
jgi:hypothetical protein